MADIYGIIYHVNIASSPNQLWIEMYHKDID